MNMIEISRATNIPERFLTGQSLVIDDQPDALADYYSTRKAVSEYCFNRTRRDLFSAIAVSRRKKRNYENLILRG